MTVPSIARVYLCKACNHSNATTMWGVWGVKWRPKCGWDAVTLFTPFHLHVSRELFQCDIDGVKLGANGVQMGGVGFQSTALPWTFPRFCLMMSFFAANFKLF